MVFGGGFKGFGVEYADEKFPVILLQLKVFLLGFVVKGRLRFGNMTADSW